MLLSDIIIYYANWSCGCIEYGVYRPNALIPYYEYFHAETLGM